MRPSLCLRLSIYYYETKNSRLQKGFFMDKGYLQHLSGSVGVDTIAGKHKQKLKSYKEGHIMTRKNLIKISEETRKNLTADLAKVQEAGYDITNISVENLISRAQVLPEVHLLDIMYQDGLKEAMKTLISYYAAPAINYEQEYPMHTRFLDVFRFCGKMLVDSTYDDFNVDENDLKIAASKISSQVAAMLIPDLEEIYDRDFKQKKDFMDLFNILNRNWSEDLFGSSIYWLLLGIMDFPAIKFVDTPAGRIKFAIWLKELTAFWPETVWNWDNFDC